MNPQVPCSRCGQMAWLNPQTQTVNCRCIHSSPVISGSIPSYASTHEAAPIHHGHGSQPPAYSHNHHIPSQPYGHGGYGPHGHYPQAYGHGQYPSPPGGHSSGVPGLPMFGKKSMATKIIGGSIAVALLGIGGTVVKYKLGVHKKKRGKVSYASLKIDEKNAVPDQLIAAAGGVANKWRRDAVWWTANFHGVKPDGTMDLSSGGTAQVVYISPKRVQSHAKSMRKDSVKKFRFSARGVDHGQRWGNRKRWQNVVPPGDASCGVQDLAVSLQQSGFKDGTIQVSFDPKFAFVTDSYSWSVKSKDNPLLEGNYSMVDCSLLRGATAAR